jgi:hypothetical protein
MRFNLDDYEPVEARIKKLFEMHEDARITTKWENLDGYIDGESPTAYVMKAYVYLTAGDQANGLPKATGYAREVAEGPQAQWAMELSETSAIGRALANMNLSGNKRASREEMEKVARAEIDWTGEADKVLNVVQARELYAKAKAAKAPAEVLDRLKDIGKALSSGSENS